MIIEGKHAEVGQGIFVSDIQEGSNAEKVEIIDDFSSGWLIELTSFSCHLIKLRPASISATCY